MRIARSHLTRFVLGFIGVIAMLPALVLAIDSVMVSHTGRPAPQVAATDVPAAAAPEDPATRVAPPDYWGRGTGSAKKNRDADKKKSRKRDDRSKKTDKARTKAEPSTAADSPAAAIEPRASVIDPCGVDERICPDQLAGTVEQLVDDCTRGGGDCPTSDVFAPLVDVVDACTQDPQGCADAIDEVARPETGDGTSDITVVDPAPESAPAPEGTVPADQQQPAPDATDETQQSVTVLLDPRSEIARALLGEADLEAHSARGSLLRIELPISAAHSSD